MRAALSYVTTEEQSASGRVCSLSPTELSWPPETSCFELFLSTSADAGFLLKVKWLLIVYLWNIECQTSDALQLGVANNIIDGLHDREKIISNEIFNCNE